MSIHQISPSPEAISKSKAIVPVPVAAAIAGILLAYLLISATRAWMGRGTVENIVNPDFETGDLTGWHKTGTAFDRQPTFGDNPKARNRESAGHHGQWWIGAYEAYQGKEGEIPGSVQGDEPVGTLTSDPFVIKCERISFLIGGGNHPWKEPDGENSTCVNLIVDGRVVRTATGSNSETMKLCVWDVSDLKGQTAVIRVVDNNQGGWGHPNFDHVRQLNRWEVENGNFFVSIWAILMILLAIASVRER